MDISVGAFDLIYPYRSEKTLILRLWCLASVDFILGAQASVGTPVPPLSCLETRVKHLSHACIVALASFPGVTS